MYTNSTKYTYQTVCVLTWAQFHFKVTNSLRAFEFSEISLGDVSVLYNHWVLSTMRDSLVSTHAQVPTVFQQETCATTL